MATAVVQPTIASLINTDQQSVLEALQRPEYVWRTVDGLAKDTHLTQDQVQTALANLSDDVLITTGSSRGRLYSTRDHYKKTQSIWGKLLTAVAGTYK